MKTASVTKIVKEIKVDVDKCTGCRACEMACSAFHAKPKYSSINPARSRIRVVSNDINDEYVPIRAGDYTSAECTGRPVYIVAGKEYSECSFCSSSCPSRDYFVEPDSGLALKCDMCESIPPLAKPMCVEVCEAQALIYSERQVETKPQEERGQIEIGLDSLISEFGVEAVLQRLAQITNQK